MSRFQRRAKEVLLGLEIEKVLIQHIFQCVFSGAFLMKITTFIGIKFNI